MKSERNELYAELMFAEVLRRYPSTKTVSFEVPGSDLNELRDSVPSKVTTAELIFLSRAYALASRFGFYDFKVQRKNVVDEKGIRIVATRGP